MKMTTEEAFIKVLQMHGIEHAFGIIGSAMMPISDLFPDAGIKFWDCAHEVNAGMSADGYTRATVKMSMAIAQNDPGEPCRFGVRDHNQGMFRFWSLLDWLANSFGGFLDAPNVAIHASLLLVPNSTEEKSDGCKAIYTGKLDDARAGSGGGRR